MSWLATAFMWPGEARNVNGIKTRKLQEVTDKDTYGGIYMCQVS